VTRLIPGGRRLGGADFEALHAAIVDAYDVDSLESMLQFRVGRRLALIASPRLDLLAQVFALIQRAEEESWTAELLAATLASRPTNVLLVECAERFGLSAATPQLEVRIKAGLPFIDVVAWREGLGRLETRVCRIELHRSGTVDAIGTGFLVGPDVVATNYHVAEQVINGRIPSEQVVLRFDYKALADGLTVNRGSEYRLAAHEWLLDHSRYSTADQQVLPEEPPASDELDYVLLRLDAPAGTHPVASGRSSEPGAPARGWLNALGPRPTMAVDNPLAILQHPDGQPLKLALDTNAIIGTNVNGTRVRYTTNTEPGASGSPCFDMNWNLVAIHQSGDPKYVTLFRKPAFNQGVPWACIVDLLERRGKRHLVDPADLRPQSV
jgi:hypothetical protein